MTKLEELKVEINRSRNKLGRFLDENQDHDIIFKLNIEIDKLIVEYHRLLMEKQKV